MDIVRVMTGDLCENCYIVINGKSAIIIDPGNDYNKIKYMIDKYTVNDISILLTHGHFDHCFACSDLQKDYNAKVYMHRLDKDMIDLGLDLSSDFNLNLAPFKVEKLVEDNQIFLLADLEIKVIHTPGHTMGGVCYVIDDAMFSGDTLFYLGIGRSDFPTGDGQLLSSSIRNKLFTLSFDYKIYPGHDRATGLFFEKENNPYV